MPKFVASASASAGAGAGAGATACFNDADHIVKAQIIHVPMLALFKKENSEYEMCPTPVSFDALLGSDSVTNRTALQIAIDNNANASTPLVKQIKKAHDEFKKLIEKVPKQNGGSILRKQRTRRQHKNIRKTRRNY